jgi:hypothetical protein
VGLRKHFGKGNKRWLAHVWARALRSRHFSSCDFFAWLASDDDLITEEKKRIT